MSAPMQGADPLRQTLEAAADEHGPFRLDTAAGHRDSAWFAEMVERFAPGGPIYLRGLHYALVAVADVVMPSNGMPYVNPAPCFQWLNDHAAKAARWLGYVPWNRIVDERNAKPEIFVSDAGAAEAGMNAGLCGYIPPLDEALPGVWVRGFDPFQEHRLAFIGEKSSLGAVLRPIAERIGAEMLLFASNASLTLIEEMVRRADDDGRPATVFYFSDFDPAGHNMATAVAHALQAHCAGGYPDRQIELHAVTLTRGQCVEHDLPGTPLSATEQRADRWLAAMGREQTEIDVLATLRPDVLRRIVEDAVADFRAAQDRADSTLGGIKLPDIIPPEPRVSTIRLRPLFTSADGFAEAPRRLVERKQLTPDAPQSPGAVP